MPLAAKQVIISYHRGVFDNVLAMHEQTRFVKYFSSAQGDKTSVVLSVKIIIFKLFIQNVKLYFSATDANCSRIRIELKQTKEKTSSKTESKNARNDSQTNLVMIKNDHAKEQNLDLIKSYQSNHLKQTDTQRLFSML